MLYITTSRKPSTNSRLFAKDLGNLLKAEYLTRGKTSLAELIEITRYNGANKLFVITDKGGNPHQIIEITVDAKTWEFSNTYFINLHMLRKSFAEDKVKHEGLRFEILSRPMHHLIRAAGIYSNDDSSSELVDKDGIVTVFYKKKEIGPRFKIFYEREHNESNIES